MGFFFLLPGKNDFFIWKFLLKIFSKVWIYSPCIFFHISVWFEPTENVKASIPFQSSAGSMFTYISPNELEFQEIHKIVTGAKTESLLKTGKIFLWIFFLVCFVCRLEIKNVNSHDILRACFWQGPEVESINQICEIVFHQLPSVFGLWEGM